MEKINSEIKTLFELTYFPIAQQRQRLNGKDFIETAVLIMDKCRTQTQSVEKLRSAAYTMVYTFNEMLDPKLSQMDIESLTDLLVDNNPITRTQIETNR